MARKGKVAYQLELPPELSDVHNVFHISQLRKCISPPVKQVDMKELELTQDLTYEEKPVRILEEMERTIRSKVIRFYKVLWEHHTGEEATWEREEFLDPHTRICSLSNQISRKRLTLRGVGL